jgi:hypothetical protein
MEHPSRDLEQLRNCGRARCPEQGPGRASAPEQNSDPLRHPERERPEQKKELRAAPGQQRLLEKKRRPGPASLSGEVPYPALAPIPAPALRSAPPCHCRHPAPEPNAVRNSTAHRTREPVYSCSPPLPRHATQSIPKHRNHCPVATARRHASTRSAQFNVMPADVPTTTAVEYAHRIMPRISATSAANRTTPDCVGPHGRHNHSAMTPPMPMAPRLRPVV